MLFLSVHYISQAEKIKTLLELIPEHLDKEIVYRYLMRCYGNLLSLE